MDYTKHQTKEETYNSNAWRYYSEYSLHMYGWYATGWAMDKSIPKLSNYAEKFRFADVAPDTMDPRPHVKIGTIMFGILGL